MRPPHPVGARNDIPRRLQRYPRVAVRSSRLDVRAAGSFRARLMGLAGLRALPCGLGLLLPATRSAHTLGMRFALDLVWLDRLGRVVRIDHGVPPARLRFCRRAVALLELAGGQAGEAGLAVGEPALRPGLGPREPRRQ